MEPRPIALDAGADMLATAVCTSGGLGHTVKALDEDLEELRARVAVLGGWGEAAVEEVLHALDPAGAQIGDRRREAERRISALVQEVERRGVYLIALRAPLADDLPG